MLRGNSPPAMRWALRWLLLAGLLGSPPCGGGLPGVTADSPTTLPTKVTVHSVTVVPPSSVTSNKLTTSKLTLPVGAPSGKPTLPASPTSPGVVEPSKVSTVGASVKPTAPSLPTKRGDTTAAAAAATTVVITAVTTSSQAPALTPVLPTAHTPSSRGITAKDSSTSGPTTGNLSPSSPSSERPVGPTAKSPGPPLISAKPSSVPGIVSGPATLATVMTAKAVTTSKDKLSVSLTSSNTLVTIAMPKPSGSPRSSTLRSSSSDSSTRPELKTTPSSFPGTTAPPVSRVPSPSSRTNLSSVQGQTKIVCENNMPPKEKANILTLNESRTCNSLEGSSLKEALMEVFCKALKPNYNPNRDDCTIWLASDPEDLKRVAVIKTSVQTYFVDEELSEVLAAKKTELEKFGVNNITYGGRPLDAEPKDHLSLPLIITIICMAASLLLVAAVYGCCHQRISQRKDQRLTEELHTIENGYHDNPTLEVMETLSEMQEKKVNLNGELGDSWIVPMDSLTKDELDEEEDTHL